MSPFEVLYGYAPKHFGIDILDSTPVPILGEWLQEKAVMQALVQQHLFRAQHRMKVSADKNRSDRSFQVGDQVYVKLQPYVQSSLAPRANQKLAFRFFGPFPVAAKVGSVAYRLELPVTSTIHPVFHVSQLKKAVGSSVVVAQLPDRLDSHQIPERVLQRRWGPNGASQGLILWSGLHPSLATWEDLIPLRQRFPRAPAWGQATCYREGNVSTVSPRESTSEDLQVQQAEAAVSEELQQQQSNVETGGPQEETTAGLRRGTRQRKANVRFQGPEWRT